MGLRETIQTAAQTAVAATGNIAVSTNYLSFVSTSIDVSAGTPATTFTTVEGVMVIYDVFSIMQIDGQAIRPTDKKILVPNKNIPGISPSENDQVIDGSTIWEVVTVKTDPAEALWELQARKP